MKPTRLLKRLFRTADRRKPPLVDVLKNIERDWDERARTNAKHYVATSRETWSDESFFRSGAICVHDYILKDLTVICNGRFPSDMKVLEIGCGAGRLLPALARLFGEVHGLDISSEMLKQAQAAVANVSNIHLHKNNGKDLADFENEVFDFVFSGIVFQHIPAKSIIEGYIREVWRVLRTGSVFKFQVQGTAISERDADTWVGVGLTERDIQTIAEEIGFKVANAQGAGTQYFWVTLAKPEGRASEYRPAEL